MDLFSFAKEMAETKAEEADQAVSETGKEDSGQTKPETVEEKVQTKLETGRTKSESLPDTETDLYPIIAPYVMEHIGEGMTKEEAAEAFHVEKGQMDAWLKRLCRDSRLKCVKGLYVKRS